MLPRERSRGRRKAMCVCGRRKGISVYDFFFFFWGGEQEEQEERRIPPLKRLT